MAGYLIMLDGKECFIIVFYFFDFYCFEVWYMDLFVNFCVSNELILFEFYLAVMLKGYFNVNCVCFLSYGDG